MRIIIKILIAFIIVVVAFYLYRKKKAEREKQEYKKYRENLAIESRSRDNERRKYEKKELPVFVSLEEKNNNLRYLYDCIDLIVIENDAKKLKSFVSQKVEDENQNYDWSIQEEFNSQKILEFLFTEKICFYGHFDWKDSATEFEKYIIDTLKKNFNIDFDSYKILHVIEDKFIHQVFEKYENQLNEIGIALRDIDIDSDSYQIVLIKKANLEQFTTLIEKIGFKLRTIQQ